MNLSQLRFAAAVAARGSFTSAASECCVTQPTLSNGIAQLEAELGERLFQRTTRTVSLTQFGAYTMPYINEVLRAQQTLERQTKSFLTPDKRLVRIGTSPLIRPQLVALITEAFRSKHPEVDVIFREMNMQDLYRMLDEGLLDFVFGVAGIHRKPWLSAPLYSEPLLYLPRGTRRTSGPRSDALPFAAISAETFVMVPDACGLARATRDLFRRHRRRLLEYSGEAMSYQVLEEWASLGIGAAIIPQSKLKQVDHEFFFITAKSGEQVRISFEAIWPQSESRARHLADFAQYLKSVVPGIVSGLTSGSAAAIPYY